MQTLPRSTHCSNVPRALRRLKSPASQLFVRKFVLAKADNKENIQGEVSTWHDAL